ncbi:unnamed protein product [Rotaria sp. Silwood2]|nr:unnamed protein product [Rotaria sp. Silwood2]CAF3154418.1 unnamed protein product [Rotaria sp. Silwood2]CAF4243110.1 unnamed protein product [Rotaria sp. Silwood2]CAF4307365.1 unnamed protein product [Rotaria sp. Silwood2]
MKVCFYSETPGEMKILRLFFCVIQLILIINLIKSQNICLNNSVLTCYCNDQMGSVTCIAKNETYDSYVDWAAFTSVDHRQYSFDFVNLTHLTSLTFTNFTLTFPSIEWLHFNFINGIDEIGENALKELNYYSDIVVDLTFTSPRNFKLADYAFGQAKYFEINIYNIQYTHIYNLPYKFNLKSMDHIQVYEMNIMNSDEIYFISNESSTIEFTEISLVNCSLKNASLLIETISTSIVDLDLSFNNLIDIPSMIKFQEMKYIIMHDNFIEEIKSNIFSNMINLVSIDLSNNRIKQISVDAFIGLSLIDLELSNNLLTSLETITNDNTKTSFLYPLNQSLALLSLSNNQIEDLYSLKEMLNLDNITICCNKIKKLDKFSFGKANRLESIDLSYNQIEFIHSLAFNETIINYLNLAGNPFSSFDQTNSFLYNIASTISSLSFSNCSNLFEINWFIITKLEKLYNLDLSTIPKTDKFWLYRKINANNSDDTLIYWNYPPGPNIILHDIRLTDIDYCLSKPIFHILNQTNLIIDIDHPCNCFLFKYKDSLDLEQRPICISNNSIMELLTKQCADIDLFCESFLNSTTTLPFTESTLSMNSSIITQTTIMTSLMTTKIETIMNITSMTRTSSITIVSSTNNIEQSSNSNQKWKIILATTISSIFIILILSLIGIYIFKTTNKNNLTENIEMHQKISNMDDKE